MPPTQPMSKDKVSGDALFILKSLQENSSVGRSNKLADVKLGLEKNVSLEFDSYFFFLRKFHYIAMDREAQLKLTEQGEQVVEGASLDRFKGEVADFFADQITPDYPSEDVQSLDNPVPSVPAVLSLEATAMTTQPPGKVARKAAGDDTLVPGSMEALRPGDSGRSPHSPEPRAASHTQGPAPLPLTAAVGVGSPVMGAATAKGQELDLRYVKFDQLGTGPLGTVFKGKHNALGLDVCIKELKDIFGYFSFLQRGEVVKRLKKELCAQAQVRHPGVVQVLDQNTDVARPYFVMELCKGSLREKLDAAGAKGLPVNQAMRCFLQLAYAMRAAHQQGLTHHNVKPENVLFDHFGNAKLTDFGLSRVIEVDSSKGMPQVFVGTGGMGYMSPELMSRAKEPGPASDVYALGILLYEMLTGQIPGRRSPLPSEINAEVPAKVDPIFDKMTQDRREMRYPDFDAVFEDFYNAFGNKEFLARGDLILSSDAA